MDYPAIEPAEPLQLAENDPPEYSRWHRYIELLVERGISEPLRVYYCQHVEEFLRWTKRKPLSDVSANEVNDYFAETLGRPRMPVWQFR